MDQSWIARVRRLWWVVLAGAAVGITVSLALGAMLPARYRSTTSILVESVPAPTLGGQLANVAINLDTEAELARSLPPDPHGALVSAEPMANAPMLVLTVEASTPAGAQAGARAYAQAYLSGRKQATARVLAEQSDALTTKLTDANQQLTDLDAQIANLRADSPQLQTLRANRLTLTTEIGTLSARITDLATTTVSAGRVIRDAAPGERNRPSTGLLLGAGAVVGLAGGALGALGRERWSRRVRRAADLSRAGLPVLAELTGDLPGLRALAPRVFAPQHVPGRAFHRLRNEVVAALAPTDQVLLVTGASPGRASTVVAANLAAALARADNEVILVGANVPELGADGLLLSHVFDIADVPGLTDVLTRRAALNRALQRAPRAPRLQVITPGGTASAAGLLQSEAVRATLDALRELARFVVVEAPSAAAGADAQSLAGLTDAAIVVVEADLTRRTEVSDAVVQLRTIGTHVLGAVLLPPLAVTDPTNEPDEPNAPVTSRGEDTWRNPGSMNGPTAVHPVVPATARRGAPRTR
jgi:Mrp family chromosome partitioning ATPase